MMRASRGSSGLVVATVGDNTIDRYVGDESARFAGGNAFNVAAQLAMRGGTVAYFGAVGADAHARTITRGLHRAGIDPAGLVTLPGATAVTTIRVTDGDRVFEHEDFGVTADYFPSDAQLERLAGARWVHVGMLPRADELRAQLRWRRDARGSGPIVSQDCAVSAGFTDLDVAFGSVGEDGDARAWAVAALEGGARFAVVTRGAAGAVATDGSAWFAQHAMPTDVVDTTGAGDAFIAGYVDARVGGLGQEVALERGARWAAAACRHRGGWPGASASAESAALADLA
ncbi:PfkB family carbohydrate kinase [Agromyces indicus]|uniref:PfkB family carbohydrate kinase n=1 Tax=Agromyces indicus TaxID=758919 RepID=A0ABU1FLX6_9MICO|nr:PfkB family carbohydrate kinase [Agromyces indicus]MDR5692773.1 PfkB family carbohydrate kinase [Agromyces indicus]